MTQFMCGRFTHEYTWPEVHAFLCLDAFRTPEALAGFEKRYNVAPTQQVPVIRTGEDGVAELVSMRWGFVPSWAKGMARASINARAETVATNRVFRAAFKERRCLVPMSGFFEWQAVPGEARKQPWYIHPADGSLWAIGGVWETAPDGMPTLALITTAANEFVAPLHDRMPLVIARESHKAWLAGTVAEADQLLAPCSGTAMAARRVSARVNRPREQGQELIAGVE